MGHGNRAYRFLGRPGSVTCCACVQEPCQHVPVVSTVSCPQHGLSLARGAVTRRLLQGVGMEQKREPCREGKVGITRLICHLLPPALQRRASLSLAQSPSFFVFVLGTYFPVQGLEPGILPLQKHKYFTSCTNLLVPFLMGREVSKRCPGSLGAPWAIAFIFFQLQIKISPVLLIIHDHPLFLI